MNRLLDMGIVAQRVRQHMPDVNLNHVSLVETIDMLLDELDIAKVNAILMENRLEVLTKKLNNISSGKPTWMDKDE
jgi:hypothetical protein